MRRLISVLLPLSCVLAAACSSASPATSRPTPAVHHERASTSATRDPSTRASGFTPWWTYHRTPARSGQTSTAPGTPLRPAWTRNLGDAVYGEPLVVGSRLIVATEGDQGFGLNAQNRHIGWDQ